MPLQTAVSLPAGSITQYAGEVAPDGWLLMYGQAISRTTYAALFLAIGTTYGAGDGSTTFNVPDLRGRLPIGKDNMGGSAANRVTSGGGGVDGLTLGAVGGSQSVTLTNAQMPSHAHTHNAHNHVNIGSNNGVVDASIRNVVSNNKGTASSATAVDSTQASTTSEQGQGSSTSHANIPPALIVNYIIKT